MADAAHAVPPTSAAGQSIPRADTDPAVGRQNREPRLQVAGSLLLSKSLEDRACATLLPATRAARIAPMEAIRGVKWRAR